MSRFTAFLVCSVLATSTFAQNIVPSAEPFPMTNGMGQDSEVTITPAPMITMMGEDVAPGLAPSMMPAFPAFGTMEPGLEGSSMDGPMETDSGMFTSEPETTEAMTTFENQPNFAAGSFGEETTPSPFGASMETGSMTNTFEPASENTFPPNPDFGVATGSGMGSEEGMNTFEPNTSFSNTGTTDMSSEGGMSTFEPGTTGSEGRTAPPTGSMAGNDGMGEKIPCEVGETVKMACMTRCEMKKTSDMCMKRCSLIGSTVCFMIEHED